MKLDTKETIVCIKNIRNNVFGIALNIVKLERRSKGSSQKLVLGRHHYVRQPHVFYLTIHLVNFWLDGLRGYPKTGVVAYVILVLAFVAWIWGSGTRA